MKSPPRKVDVCGDDVVLPNVSFSVVNNYSFTGLESFSKLTKYLLFLIDSNQ